MLKLIGGYVKRFFRAMGPVIVACIFLGAVYLLYKEISKYSLEDIKSSLSQISTGALLLSLFLATINYIILIGYDWLALKGIHKVLPMGKVSLVSFVGQAVSYNFGALLGGSTVRFRFYSSWGFSPMDIVRLILMLAITFWVGALGLVGAIFVIAPPEIPAELGMHMPLEVRPLGAILCLIAISYLVVCKFIHKPIHIFGKEFAFPPFKIAIAQALVAGADLIAAGACLYVLLPPDSNVTFIQFLPTYLMAMVAVVLTHVPGGAGVLEVVILHLTTASPQSVFAALLCFRVIYYLLPLLLAAIIFALYEVHQQTVHNNGALHNAGRWMHAFAPTVMSVVTFIGGVILCFSALLPTNPNNTLFLVSLTPEWLSSSMGALCGICGILLLFFAPGVQHRQENSFRLVCITLWVAIAAVLLESTNWVSAFLLLLVFLGVFSVRKRCRRTSTIWKLHLTPRWSLSGAGIILCAAAVGIALHHPEMETLITVLVTELLFLVLLAFRYVQTAPLRAKKK